MSKHYLTQATKSFRSLFALCLLLVVGTLTAQADDIKTLGALELDTPYEVGMFTEGVGSWTATENGVLTVSSSGSYVLTPYSDEACTKQITVTNLKDSNYHSYYNLDVTAGTTYYFKQNNFLGSATQTLTFSNVKTLSYTGASLDAGSAVNCTANSQISVYFDNSVSCSGVSIVYGDNGKKPIEFNTGSTSVFFEVKDAIYNLMNKGELKEGDKFSFVLSGVTLRDDATVKAGEDGTVSIEYVCGAKPVALVSATNFDTTHVFRSFWTKGNADGLVTLTFDGPIKVLSNDRIKLTYGDFSSGAEASDRYYENPEYTVTEGGKVLTIDLTDKERTPASMLGISTIYDKMLLQVSNLVDLNNNPVYSTASGSKGSFTVQYPYEITNVNASVEFTPASGSSLADVDNVEIFATDYDKFSFSGAVFHYQYADGGTGAVGYDKEDLIITADADIKGAYTIKVPVDETVKNAKNVYLTLTDLKAANGKNYQSLFTAKYNGFTVQSMTYQASADAAPQEMIGAEMDSLVSEQPITIKTNYDNVVGNDSISYVGYSIEDLNPIEGDDAIIVSPTHIENYDKDAQAWVGDVVGLGTTKLLIGHTYRIVVTGYQQIGKYYNMYKDIKVGSDTIYIYGTQADYVYSDVLLESVEPTTITAADDFNLTVTFDGMVKIVEGSTCIAGGGNSDNMYFDTVEAVDGTDGYSNVWKLGLSESKAKSQEARYATVNIAAEDMDGHRVKGNFGDRATTITQQELFLAYNGADITVSPESESTVTSLSYFDVTAPSTIGMGALATSEAYVLNRDTRTRVVVDSTALVYSESVQQIIDDSETLSEVEMQEKYGTYWFDMIKTNTMRIFLKEEITEPGVYILNIPDDYFTSGTQFDSENTRAFTGYYYIDDTTPVDGSFETDPENGSYVDKLGTISITFTNIDEISLGSGMITVSKDGEQIARIDAEIDWFVYSRANITVDYTEKGVYTFDIPEGYFQDASGNALPAVKLTYTIGEAPTLNFTSDPANGSTVDELSKIDITLTDYADDDWDAPTVTVDDYTIKVMKDGKQVATATIKNDPSIGNLLHMTLSETLTETGVYTIVVPEGVFVDGDSKPLPGLTLVYGIGTPTGINNAKANANGKDIIYNLNGLRVNGKLPAGIYIVNGRKVVVK